ncbi:hypothetical protein [Pseudomonas fulva]|uniref:hypothetical protein n=1 Tax=Pseudomonas fulva TaxID=47880 RepID=UPI0032EB1975
MTRRMFAGCVLVNLFVFVQGICVGLLIERETKSCQLQAVIEVSLPASPHETQPEPTPALAPRRWIDERYEL